MHICMWGGEECVEGAQCVLVGLMGLEESKHLLLKVINGEVLSFLQNSNLLTAMKLSKLAYK